MDPIAILTASPTEPGEIIDYKGASRLPYRIRRLGPGEMNNIRIERNLYLAERGITECTPATAEIFDQELELRVVVQAVMHPDKDEPLAPLETWRTSTGPAVRTCIAHYSKLEAQDMAIDMAESGRLRELRDYVRKEGGTGQPAYWATVHYETLLACFAKLCQEHDQAERDMKDMASEINLLRAANAAHESKKKKR